MHLTTNESLDSVSKYNFDFCHIDKKGGRHHLRGYCIDGENVIFGMLNLENSVCIHLELPLDFGRIRYVDKKLDHETEQRYKDLDNFSYRCGLRFFNQIKFDARINSLLKR